MVARRGQRRNLDHHSREHEVRVIRVGQLVAVRFVEFSPLPRVAVDEVVLGDSPETVAPFRNETDHVVPGQDRFRRCLGFGFRFGLGLRFGFLHGLRFRFGLFAADPNGPYLLECVERELGRGDRLHPLLCLERRSRVGHVLVARFPLIGIVRLRVDRFGVPDALLRAIYPAVRPEPENALLGVRLGFSGDRLGFLRERHGVIVSSLVESDLRLRLQLLYLVDERAILRVVEQRLSAHDGGYYEEQPDEK